MVVACGVVERAEEACSSRAFRAPRSATALRSRVVQPRGAAHRRRARAHCRAWSDRRNRAGTSVRADSSAQHAALGTCALGRAIDARGRPLDAGPPLAGLRVRIAPLQPVRRAPIDTPLWTGIRAIDALLTLGVGSRTGVFGAPGSGKTTILEMLARGCAADAIVLALVGERGREAQAWMRAAIGGRPSSAPAAIARRGAPALRAGSARACLRVARTRPRRAGAARQPRACRAALRELAVANGESVGRGGFRRASSPIWPAS